MEKENKPLSDKDYNRIRQICVNLAIEQTELKHKQAVKEAYEELYNSTDSGYLLMKDVKQTFKDKFGFEF